MNEAEKIKLVVIYFNSAPLSGQSLWDFDYLAMKYSDVEFVYKTLCTETASDFETHTVPKFAFRLNYKDKKSFDGYNTEQLRFLTTKYRIESQLGKNLIDIINEKDFNTRLTIAQIKLIVIDFDGRYSRNLMVPFMKRQAHEHLDVMFFRVDIETSDKIAKRFNIIDNIIEI